MSQVDLSQLAIDRSAPSQVRGHTRLRLFTRFLLPGVLIFGFLALITWAARDFIFHRHASIDSECWHSFVPGSRLGGAASHSCPRRCIIPRGH